jgi:NtrC-family two-component system sensor histidine kinase KinB
MTQERPPRSAENPAQGVTNWTRLEAELQQQKDVFASQLAIARATTEHPALEKTLQSILDVMTSLTGAEGATLFLFDEAGGLSGRLVTQSPQPPQQPTQASRLLARGLMGWVARNRKPALVHDTVQDERWLTLELQRQETRAALCVPILMGEVLLGVLTLIHSRPRHFSEAQLHFVQGAGDQLALALRNAQVFDAMKGLADRQRTLYEVLRAAGGTLDPDAALQTAVHAITRHTGWSHMDVVVPSPDGTRWQVRASTPGRGGGVAQPIGSGVLGRAYRSRRTQLVPDVAADSDYLAGSPVVRSELAVPLRRGDRILGLLNVESDVPDAFRPEDVQLAESLADAVSLALDNANLYQAVAADEERLRSLIAASRDGILFAGNDGRVQVINEPALRLLGLSRRAEDWLGHPVDALASRLGASEFAESARVLSEVTDPARAAAPPGEGEHESGGFVVRWADQPVLSDGAPLGRLLLLRDVTEERRLERLRDDLSHTMIHDLRSPVTSIQCALDLLAGAVEPALGPSDRQMLNLARSAAQKLRALVDSILELSRLEQAAMPLQRQGVFVSGLVADALSLYAPQAREKELRLDEDVPADLPRLWADPELVARVLQNLVGNAVKFVPRGGAVSVSARLEENDPELLRISVMDTGTTLPADGQSRLFRKFATGDQRERGSGLGLAFCKLAVEAHGGRIWLDGVSPRGTCFAFTLPIV